MRCHNCDFENPPSAKFCINCGTALVTRCQHCGFDNPPAAKFCAQCGNGLGPAFSRAERGVLSPTTGVRPEPGSEVRDSAEGERKTVTALFADIKGSTELLEHLDPEEAREIVDPVLRLMSDAVHRYDGYVVQSTGDGIFALFGAPVSHEEHPQLALHAAITMQDAIKRYAVKLKAQGRPPIEARVGVNTGEVVFRKLDAIGRAEYSPIGLTSNLAERLQALASDGGIVVSENTQRVVEGYFSLKPMGPVRVKGIAQPINAFEVLDVGPLRSHFELAAQRGLTKFVGREREIAEMMRAFDLSKRGYGQIVAAVAEAGTGKSRLFHEFKRLVKSECLLFETYAVSHAKASAYQPIVELLHSYFLKLYRLMYVAMLPAAISPPGELVAERSV